MTIEWFTGWEGCGSTGDCKALIDGSANIIYDSTAGYGDSKVTRMYNPTAYFYKNCTPAKTKCVGSYVIGIGTDSYSTNAYDHVFRFTVGSDYIRVFNTSSGIEVYRNATKIASCVDKIAYVSFDHVEFKLFSNASTGTVQMKINGDLVIDESGLDTGGDDISVILFGTSGGYARYDNVFIADDWQGAVKIDLISPNSDTSVQFTPSAGSDNYAMVDETEQDGDSTYNESSTDGHIDLLGYESAISGKNILALMLVTPAKRANENACSLKHKTKQDSTTYDGDTFVLDTAYPDNHGEGIYEVLTECPDGTALTSTKVDAMSFGYEVVHP
jgi:hypothetical protein